MPRYTVTLSFEVVLEAPSDDVAKTRAEVVASLLQTVPSVKLPEWFPDIESPTISVRGAMRQS